LRQEAVRAVTEAPTAVLTDRTVYDGERRYIDPHLATSAIDQALSSQREGTTCGAAARSCCGQRRSATSTT